MNYANNAHSVLNGSITSVATAITLATGTGSRFPASDFRVTLIGYDVSGNENAWEICHCTTRSGDLLTVTRAQEGTTAVEWANATRIENRITGGTMNMLLEKSGGAMTGSLSAPSFQASGSYPFLQLQDTDGPTDKKHWRWSLDGGTYRLENINDAYNAVVMTPIAIDQYGNTTLTGSTGINTAPFGGAALTLPNGQLLALRNAAGGLNGGTAGTMLLKHTDDHLYLQNYEGDFVYQGAGWTERLRITSNGKLVNYGTSGVVQAELGTLANRVAFNVYDGGAAYATLSSTNSTAFGIGTQAAIPLLLMTSNTTRVTITPAGNTEISGALLVTPTDNAARLEVGHQRADNGIAYIDLVSRTGADYNARILRGGGLNDSLDIANTGTGGVYIVSGSGVTNFASDGSLYVGAAPGSGERAIYLGDTTNPGYFYGNANGAGFYSANGAHISLDKRSGANSNVAFYANNAIWSVIGGQNKIAVAAAGVAVGNYGVNAPVAGLDIYPNDSADEGGEAKFRGATNSNWDWNVDAYLDQFRVFRSSKGSMAGFSLHSRWLFDGANNISETVGYKRAVRSDGTMGVDIAPHGGVEIWRADGAGHVDFKTSPGEDYDCRIQQSSGTNGLNFIIGGTGAQYAALSMTPNDNYTFSSGRLRSSRISPDAGWYSAQMECYESSGSSVDFARITFHVQDAAYAAQFGYHHGHGRVGLFDASGNPQAGWNSSYHDFRTNGRATAGNWNAMAEVTGTTTLDVYWASYFRKTISGATTFSLANVSGANEGVSFILELVNGGAHVVTWWANIRWAGGTVPTLTASGTDILGFYTIDGGSNWRGMLLAKDSK